MVFRASCFGGQLSWWRVCFAISLHGGHLTVVSCLAASLRRSVVVYRTQIHKEQVGEDTQITAADLNTELNKSLKTGNALCEDDIRPEMLKAMNMYGVRRLTRICKVACKTEQAPMQWQINVIIPIHKTGDKRKCTNYRGISLISVPGKVYAKCLEGSFHVTLWDNFL